MIHGYYELNELGNQRIQPGFWEVDVGRPRSSRADSRIAVLFLSLKPAIPPSGLVSHHRGLSRRGSPRHKNR